MSACHVAAGNDDGLFHQCAEGRLTWQLGEIPLPGWMCRFVFLVDGLHKEDKHVTTDTALSVLAIGDDVDSKAPVPAPVLEPALAV